jgi:hypothetical protein
MPTVSNSNIVTTASQIALQEYAQSFLSYYSIDDAEGISVTVDQFELDRSSYATQEQFDKKYTLLSHRDDTVLVLSLESAFANFLLQTRYGGYWGEGRLWNVSRADSFLHCCNQIAQDIAAIVCQKGIELAGFEAGIWHSSINDLLEDHISLFSVHSMVVSLETHKVALQFICAQKPAGISFEDSEEIVPDEKQDGAALHDFIRTMPVILAAETPGFKTRFAHLLKLRAGDMLPFRISEIEMKVNDQIVGHGDIQEVETGPVVYLQKFVLPSRNESTHANS